MTLMQTENHVVSTLDERHEAYLFEKFKIRFTQRNYEDFCSMGMRDMFDACLEAHQQVIKILGGYRKEMVITLDKEDIKRDIVKAWCGSSQGDNMEYRYRAYIKDREHHLPPSNEVVDPRLIETWDEWDKTYAEVYANYVNPPVRTPPPHWLITRKLRSGARVIKACPKERCPGIAVAVEDLLACADRYLPSLANAGKSYRLCVSVEPHMFLKLGYYGVDNNSCYRFCGQSQTSPGKLAMSPHSVVFLLKEYDPKLITHEEWNLVETDANKIVARAWGFITKDHCAYTNVYPNDGSQSQIMAARFIRKFLGMDGNDKDLWCIELSPVDSVYVNSDSLSTTDGPWDLCIDGFKDDEDEDHCRCGRCNHQIHVEDAYYGGDGDGPYCERCFDSRYVWSEHHYESIRRSDAVQTHDDDWIYADEAVTTISGDVYHKDDDDIVCLYNGEYALFDDCVYMDYKDEYTLIEDCHELSNGEYARKDDCVYNEETEEYTLIKE